MTDANLQAMSDKLEKAARANPGANHDELVNDIKTLLTKAAEISHDAEAMEFHDFANQKYATPKVTLVGMLDELIVEAGAIMEKAKGGSYDNESPKIDEE